MLDLGLKAAGPAAHCVHPHALEMVPLSHLCPLHSDDQRLSAGPPVGQPESEGSSLVG